MLNYKPVYPRHNRRLGQIVANDLSPPMVKGRVIAYPTEAVWGLGCLPNDYAAVNKLLALKKRPWQKGLILVSSEIEHFTPFIEPLAAEYRQQLMGAWPGPVTFILPIPEHYPVAHWLRGQHRSIALRVSNHPTIRALSRSLNSPLVSTSANPGSRIPAKSAAQVHRYFRDQVDILVHGDLGNRAKPTEIRHLLTNQIIRA